MRGEGIELCKRIELERNCNYNDRAFPFYLVRIIHASVWGLIENKTARGSVFGVYTRRRLTVRVNRNPLNYLELAKSAAATSEQREFSNHVAARCAKRQREHRVRMREPPNRN